jgi:hypothetical protein
MILQYISHSCFVIETDGTRLAFDPWITATAYHNQWFLHPRPVDDEPARNADYILISHGHDDHLNQESLKLIQKNAHIFFPFQWRKGIASYMRHLGFNKITEAVSYKTYQFKNIKVTYLGYSLESVIVVECEGFTIVNINDALNSNHETAVEYLLKEIKSRWKKIDFMLSGWSGAGYFPNNVHYNAKDDEEVARIREQYFANNFCRFAKELQPDIAVAFAPGFILLNDENRWINEVKFPREILPEYYDKNFEQYSPMQFPMTYPGDYFIDKEFHKVSAYHNNTSEKEIYGNLDALYKDEIAMANHINYVSNEEINVLEHTLTYWLDRNKSLYHANVIDDAVFSIKFTDVKELNYFNVCFKDGSAVVARRDRPALHDRLIIETKASLLALNLEKEWGGDLLSIGYGININVFDELSLEKNLDIVCVRLISRFPNFKQDILSHSPRAMKYYFSNPGLTNLWLSQKLKLKPYVNKYPFNERDHWITYNKCDLCKVCNMPEVDFDSVARR